MQFLFRTAPILLLLQWVSAEPCCSGNATISGPLCSDGKNISILSILTCENRFSTNQQEDKDLMIDKSGALNLGGEEGFPDFCFGKQDDDTFDTYIVCYSEKSVGSNLKFYVMGSFQIISALFIILTMYIYLRIPDLLDLQEYCMLHSIGGLATAFLLFGYIQLTPFELAPAMCHTIAYLLYVTMFYSFFWLNALSFHIWRTIYGPKFLARFVHWKRIYTIYGVIGPCILLGLLILANETDYMDDLHPRLAESKCWFHRLEAQFLYFYAPFSVLLLFNIIYYVSTITILWKQYTAATETRSRVLKFRLILCVKLMVIMGITWIFEILSVSFENSGRVLEVLFHIGDAINALQGILIFLVLVVFRKRVIRGLAEMNFCGIRFPSKWKTLNDEECEIHEEEAAGLSVTQVQNF